MSALRTIPRVAVDAYLTTVKLPLDLVARRIGRNGGSTRLARQKRRRPLRSRRQKRNSDSSTRHDLPTPAGQRACL